MNPSQNQPTLFASLRQLPRPVWILFAGVFLNKFGGFVIPFLTLYMKDRGFSVAQSGTAMAAYGVGHFLACVIGGKLADSLGRRACIAISMFASAAAMLALSQAAGFFAIVSLTLLAGLCGELYRPASSALLADLVPQGQRVRAFAAYRMAFNAGWAFGPATAGFLSKHSFFWLFAGDALTSALFGVVALLALPKGAIAHAREAGWGEAFALMKHDRKFHCMLAASLLIGIVFFQMVSTFGLHMQQIGYTATTYGLIISMNGAIVVLCELPLTLLSQRYKFERVMIVGYICAGLGFATLGFVTGIPAIVGCMMIFTLGEMLTMPLAVAQVADLAPAAMRGRYMGAYGFTWASALTLGPIVGTNLFQLNNHALWIVCGALSLLAAVVILRMSPRETTPALPKSVPSF